MIKHLTITADFNETGFNTVTKALDEDGRQIKITTREVQSALLNICLHMTAAIIDNRFTHSPVERGENEE